MTTNKALCSFSLAPCCTGPPINNYYGLILYCIMLQWLTSNPSEVQFAFSVVHVWAQSLKCQLEFLSVERMPDAQLLQHTPCTKKILLKYSTTTIHSPLHQKKGSSLMLWPFQGHSVRHLVVFVQSGSTAEPDSHTGPNPAPAATHTPAPYSSMQTGRQAHFEEWHKDRRHS